MPTPNDSPPALTTYPRSLGHSSARYGPCEVCGRYASDVSIGFVDEDGVKLVGTLPPSVIFRATARFGHAECLGGAAR